MTQTLKIERYDNPEITAKETAKYINDLLTQYVEQPVLLLLAGGSAVSVFEYIKPEYLSPDITVTTTDDRFSTELDINNFSILQSTSFYNSLVEADAFCISTEPFEDETLEMYRARFEKNLREWKQDFPNGKIIALYGMGADGHTGGMIPGLLNKLEFDTEFNDDERLVGVFDAKLISEKRSDVDLSSKYEFPQRISTSLAFMRKWVDHAAFYITGEKKKPALDAISAIQDDTVYENVDFSAAPISIARFMRDAVIFTDIK